MLPSQLTSQILCQYISQLRYPNNYFINFMDYLRTNKILSQEEASYHVLQAFHCDCFTDLPPPLNVCDDQCILWFSQFWTKHHKRHNFISNADHFDPLCDQTLQRNDETSHFWSPNISWNSWRERVKSCFARTSQSALSSREKEDLSLRSVKMVENELWKLFVKLFKASKTLFNLGHC